MPERVVKVRLTAVIDDYKRGMVEAANATRAVGSESEKLAQTRQSMQLLGGAGVAMGAALAAGIGVAVAKFAEFDQAMSFVAATGQDARENIDGLRQAALDAGASTVFSATEAANAIEEMAKAGMSATEIIGGGLKGALDLAAAGGLGVAEASGIAATTLQQFGLDGTEASHVADLLAAGAGKAMGDVSDMSEAMKQSGLVANQFGLSVEESTGTLAAFAQAGLLGSDAGTSFRTMLLRLANPTGEAAALMKDLKINAYDAGGQFVGMAGLAGQLEQGMSGLTDEQKNANLAIIFGQDAIRGANVLLKEGARGIADWTNKVNDQGYAAETAAIRLDNLAGDWEKLTGAMDSAFISMGEGANGPLRDVLQSLTELVDGFNSLPDWAKQSALGVAVLTAGISLVGGAALLALPKIIEVQVAMQTLGITGASTRAGLARLATFLTGPWGIALVGAAAGVVALQMATDSLKTSTEEFQNVLQNAKSGSEILNAADSALPIMSRLKEATKDVETFKSKLDIIANNDFLRGLDRSTSQLANSLRQTGMELSTLASTDLPAAQNAFRLIAEQWGLQGEDLNQLLDAMGPQYKKALQEQANQLGINTTTMTDAENAQALLNLAMGETPGVSDPATEAISEMEAAAVEADEALSDMHQALEDVARGALGLAEAKDAALSAINGMAEAAAAEGSALDGSNDASIRLRDSVREVEQAHRDSAAAILENGGTLEEAQGAWAAGRQAVIDMMVAKGMDIEQARAWADQNLGTAGEVSGALAGVKSAVDAIPKSPHINVTAETASAAAKFDTLWRTLTSLANKTWNIPVATTQVGKGTVLLPDGNANGGIYGPGGVKEFAGGGFEPGIYPYTPGGIHKFAEEYGEAYISMDPRRRERSERVWVQAGQRMGFMGSQQASAPQLSLDGLSITGTFEIGGDGLGRIIDGRIRQRGDAVSRGVRNGRWSDA